jgi:transposase
LWISPDATFPSDSAAFEQLRLENEELRARVVELTELLEGTHRDLLVANEALRETHDALREAAGQEARIATLEASLQAMETELERRRRESSRHSGNSGKPPSSDTLTQKASKDGDRLSRSERRRIAKGKLTNRDKPKRRPGKQPGDPGSSLARVADPDFTQLHVPDSCGFCGESLEDAEVTWRESRQVFDLPTRRLEVTEHTSQSRHCGCGHVTKAPFPAEAKAPTSYGPRVRAVGLYLMAGQHIPVARAAALLAQVCGAPVSTGFLAGLAAEAAGGLGEFREALRSILVAEDVLHADETGARISGARYWFHVACTDLVTLLDCHERRGTEAFTDMGVLPFFSGVLVSDGWKPYWSIGAFEHALCAAHLLRDLASVAETRRHKGWADDMADLLVEAKGAVEGALGSGRDGLNAYELILLRSRYTKIVKRGLATVPERHSPGTADREAFNLLRRFEIQRHEVTRYWSDARVSPDNNQAERDLRMVKLQQKISGCFRTVAGAKAFCAVRSYIHTGQKHGVEHLELLVRLFSGEPWMPPAASSP